MSIVQRLDGSRVRKEKQFKKTVQKDSSMHGSKQNRYKQFLILGEKEVGVRHTWWERGSLFSLLAGASLFARFGPIPVRWCTCHVHGNRKLIFSIRLDLLEFTGTKNNLTCYSKSLLSSSTPPQLVPVLLRDCCDPREPWELNRLSEVWEPFFTTSSREGGCAGWRSFWNACIEELRGNF